MLDADKMMYIKDHPVDCFICLKSLKSLIKVIYLFYSSFPITHLYYSITLFMMKWIPHSSVSDSHTINSDLKPTWKFLLVMLLGQTLKV